MVDDTKLAFSAIYKCATEIVLFEWTAALDLVNVAAGCCTSGRGNSNCSYGSGCDLSFARALHPGKDYVYRFDQFVYYFYGGVYVRC